MILYELFHYLNHTLMFGVSRQTVCSQGDGADAFSLSKVWVCGAVEGTYEETSQVRGFERDLDSSGSSGNDNDPPASSNTEFSSWSLCAYVYVL